MKKKVKMLPRKKKVHIQSNFNHQNKEFNHLRINKIKLYQFSQNYVNKKINFIDIMIL